MSPQRIQRRRTKGWRMPAGAVCVSRPSQWGNRYVIGGEIEHVDGSSVTVRDRAHAVALHREWIDDQMRQWTTFRLVIQEELGGRDLCCWCPPGEPCHADTLIELANP
ncbi:DUF4326 domain-containing protein [Reyranella sp.]|uniref:DUF4326 domain-containing protein n=1 Tax=Reyranella sp. TaxID=1929291 RepID=UPI003D0C1408